MYENAPATKLLATNCACCGRALVDAESVERGTGPDCAEKYGVADASGEPNWELAARLLVGTGIELVVDGSPRDAANKLVYVIARALKSIDRVVARKVFSAIHALGFTLLAERIAKRFHASIIELDEETRKLRAEYATIRASYCYDNATPAEFNAEVGSMKPRDAADWVACAKNAACKCKACGGSGVYTKSPYEAGNECFRCGGKGEQSQVDVDRNRAYDRFRTQRRTAA